MKLDPHIHSCYSGDAMSSPKNIIDHSRKIKLDIIAISDHDAIKGSRIASEISKNFNDILVIPSIEITSSEGHILGFGVDSVVEKGLSPEETVEKINDEGGIAIIPHPFSFYRSGFFFKNKKAFNNLIGDCNSNCIKGIEVLNARYIIGYSNHKSNKAANKYNLAKIGSSDSHFIESIGNCYTEIIDIDSEPTIDDVIDAIKPKNTIARGKRTSNYLIAKEVFNKKIRRIY